MKFSANLGFLWNSLALPDAIHRAHEAGFDAVECHWPYAVPAEETRAALATTGLPLLGLNTIRGAPGENGLAALPGREGEARAAITQAIQYADATDAGAIHVMAGFAEGPGAQRAFEENLRFACGQTRRTILIEPLNRHDAPGYFLRTTDQARGIIEDLALPNLRLMFDCYHVGRTEGDITTRLTELLPIIGHIQIAAVPDRGTPDHGEVNYTAIYAHLETLGWAAPLGAEFKAPDAAIGAWLGNLRR